MYIERKSLRRSRDIAVPMAFEVLSVICIGRSYHVLYSLV